MPIAFYPPSRGRFARWVSKATPTVFEITPRGASLEDSALFRPDRGDRSAAAIGLFEGRDVELHHLEERRADALRGCVVLRVRPHPVVEHRRNDLPPQAVPIHEPTARLRLASCFDE